MKWADLGALFTPSEKTKLAGIDTGATDDQTGAEVKTAYEGEADTNAYDDAAVTKLAGIDAGADVTGSNPPQTHGASVHTDRTRTEFIAAPHNTSGLLSDRGAYLDSGTDEYSVYRFKMPVDYVSIGSYKVLGERAAALTGDVILDVRTQGAAAGEFYNQHDVNETGISVTVSSGVQMLTTVNTNAFANITKDDYMYVKVNRDANNGSDTLGCDYVIVGLLIEYTADM